MQITLLFPDALVPDPSAAAQVLPLAQRLFGRSRVLHEQDDASAVPLQMPWEQWLEIQFGLAEGSSVQASTVYTDLPSLSDDAESGRLVARVTPVNLHLGLDHAVLSSPNSVVLNQEQASNLAAAIVPTLAAAGLTLLTPQPTRWYLVPLNPEGNLLNGVSALGWRAAAGRNIEPYGPRGSKARQWRRLVTEIQMIWHEHPVNQARRQQGLPAINSLWFDGVAGSVSRSNYDVIFSDIDSVSGLAAAVKCARVHDPVQFGRSDLAPTARVLLATDSSNFEALESNDPQTTQSQLWRYIENTVTQAKEIMAARSHRNDSFVRAVLSGNRRLSSLLLQPSDGWAFWRKRDVKACFEHEEPDLPAVTVRPARR